MSLYLSASTATQEQAVANSNDFTVHALRRDKDGMFHYTVARSTEDDVFDFHRTDGEEYKDFLQVKNMFLQHLMSLNNIQTILMINTNSSGLTRRLTYFIDDDGYLVARLNKEYDHTTQGPK